jgi:oxygen-independent coproporphyrinogen III oxidase
MDPQLLKYAERHAPRYTSYPTAPHFRAEIDATQCQKWLSLLPADAHLSLYVHVPYCKRICWYCGCNTNAVHPGDTADYCATLMDEVELVAARAGGNRVTELHWGGGTPNTLTSEEFTRLLHHIAFWFDLDKALSHSIEIDPRYLSSELAATYAAAAVTRASVGVQTLAPHVQQAIGRVQPYESISNAVDALRRAGVGQISFDLMYGLPLQSLDDLLHTIQLSAALRPNRIALFGYAHVPWFKRRQRVISEASLPAAEARIEQAETARAALTALGYAPVGIDHYAWPDDPLARAANDRSIRRNFQGYVTAIPDAIIGLGPSAISSFRQGYVQNETGIGPWRRAIETGRLAVARGHVRSGEDERRATIIEQLMCAFDVDLSAHGGRSAFARELEILAPLAADGLVRIDGDCVVIPEGMRPLARLIAQAFDAYGEPTMTHHSRAV